MKINKKINKSIIILFLLALLVEIFVFNLRTFQTSAYQEKKLDTSYGIELVGGEFDAEGDIVMNEDADFVTLNITGFGYPLNNVRLDVECLGAGKETDSGEPVCIAECSAFDDALFEKIGPDGASYLQNGAVMTVKADILHKLETSHYLFLDPFGNTHKIQLVLYPKSGVPHILRIHDLTFNAVKPMRFNPVRIVVIFMILLIVYFTLIDQSLWQEECMGIKKWKFIILLGLYAAFAVFASYWMLSDRAILSERFSPYSELAKAIAEGRLYVGEANDTVIGTEGHSVFWRGDSTEVMFDYAYYNGKYYVYFGLLPCILFYLPYHLMTGADLPNAIPGLFLRLMIVGLVGRLIWNLIKNYYRKIPVALFLLMWWGTVCGMYIPALMTEMIMFYDVPILSGTVLILAGICFFTDIGKLASKKDFVKLALGSICLASVSLCRPTMLLYGFVIVGYALWNRRAEIRAGGTRLLMGTGVSVILPYSFFALVCMVYNATRFGSPFDFGASYNATTYPIEGATLFLPYVVARSVYEYLLKPPFVDFGFPFTKFNVWEKVRVAGNIMVVDMFVGGILAANPFTWSLALVGFYRQKLKQKRIFYPAMLCIMTALILMVYGVIFTSSVYTRYTVEFSPAILIGGCIVIMEIYEDVLTLEDEHIRNILRLAVALVLLVSIAWGGVQLCCAETGSAGITMGNAELWYRLKYGFRIF